MNNGKIRIYELSKELNLDNRDILAICKQLNIAVISHSSTITEAEAEQIRAAAARDVASQSDSKPSLSQAVESRKKTPLNIQKKQQILEIRRPPPTKTSDLTLRRTPRTAQGYIEPLLDMGNALPFQMVLIPGGAFVMGSPTTEIDRSDDESPQHTVTVPKFFMGRYPITQSQWRTVAALPKVDRELDRAPSHFKGENHPVERVSWYDAIEFCARLKQLTNRPYRLPSEAEWEYACRAGTTTPFYFGKTLTDELANYNASITYADAVQGEYREKTTPVNYFGVANAFGLSDMHGNVFEWCGDHWHDSYEEAPNDGSAWLSNREDSPRVRRGGSWLYNPRFCRSAYRVSDSPDDRDDLIGFRVVCSAPRTS